MKCENLQFNLSLYLDNFLTDDERAVLDAHLVRCPLCRQKLDDFRALRFGLQKFAAAEMPVDLVNSVKQAVRLELAPQKKSARRFFSAEVFEFLQMRVMPFAVGTAASLFFGFSLLWILLSGFNNPNETEMAANSKPSETITLIKNFPVSDTLDSSEISPSTLASERVSVSGESPSLNPQGALIALTKSLSRGKIKDEEVVIVADVLSNGLANIEEVVEPLDDQQTVYELEKAFNQNSNDAPFVPAFLDKRADSVRVVLKIQQVEVKTSKPKTKRK